MPNEVLKIVADNPALLNALKTVILEQFSLEEVNTNMTNDNIGQLVRSRVEGMRRVEGAFREIEKYKTPKPSGGGKNPAR